MPQVNLEEFEELKKKVNDLSFLFYGHQHTGSDYSKLLENARIRFRSLDVGGNDIVVRPGDNIQAANDEIAIRGQGRIILGSGTFVMTANLNMSSGVSLVGQGQDITILDFGSGARGVKYIGTGVAIKKNFVIKDLTIQNSNNTAGLDMDYCDNFTMENVRVTSCDQKGLRIQHSQRFIITNFNSNSNTGNGFEVVGDGTRASSYFNLLNCNAESNGGIGFAFSAGGTSVFYFNLLNCTSSANTGDGYDFAIASGNPVADANIIGCLSSGNAIGFDCDLDRINFIGCIAEGNSADGFEIAGTRCKIIGSHSSDPYDLQSAVTIFRGNTDTTAGLTQIFPSFTLANGDNNNVDFDSFENVKIAGPTGAFAITGIANPYGGAVVRIYNSVAQNMTISHQSASSDEAKRIITSTGADVATTGVGMATLVYSDSDSRWILMSIEA